jgi:type IV secretion system protein VirB1
MIDVIALAFLCYPQVAPETMSAVVKHESRANPYLIYINGPARLSRQPTSAEEAIEVARRLDAAGLNFDSGVGQINSSNVKKFDASWEEVFNPCGNLRLAERVLVDCYARAGSDGSEQDRLGRALSCYNTGDHKSGFANGYVQRVYAAARSDDKR